MADFNTWLGVVGLGFTFLAWGLDKSIEVFDKRKKYTQITYAIKIILGPSFFIFGIIILTSAKLG